MHIYDDITYECLQTVTQLAAYLINDFCCPEGIPTYEAMKRLMHFST